MLSQRGTRGAKEPPPGFSTIQDILEGHVSVKKVTSVIGVVKDQRLPISTGGTDWKSSLTIYDASVDYSEGLVVNIFRPGDKIPRPDAGDVVVVRSAKVQSWNGGISLITNRQTVIHIYSGVQIPEPPASARQALQPASDSGRWMPDARVHDYVPWLYHIIDKQGIPEHDEFRVQVERSLNVSVKEKFSTLDKVRAGRYHDVIVQVVKNPFDEGGTMSLWVTDYTENDEFFLFSWDSTHKSDDIDYDQNMYTVGNNKSSRNWPGPFGKRSMQVSCWEPHADFVRQKVEAGTWVQLRNLHVKFGHNTKNLEGFLHEDQIARRARIQVEILQTTDPASMDDRLKEALKRKRLYLKNKKTQKMSYGANEREGGTKRKADDAEGPVTLNAKARRALERAVSLEKHEKQREVQLGLNKRIRCESETQDATPVSAIVEPVLWTKTIEGEEVAVALPFVCLKYRANVRVVDFRPRRLEDFASWRKKTEFDALSDNSGDEGGGDGDSMPDDSDEDRVGGGGGTLDAYRGEKAWEWRFALRLEGVDAKGRSNSRLDSENDNDGNTLWAVVDNTEAQQLLDLDACDLRANPAVLSKLREQLFKLWGNLEEVKAAALAQRRAAAAGRQPPPDSSPPQSSPRAAATTSAKSKATKATTTTNRDGSGREGGKVTKDVVVLHRTGKEQQPQMISNKPFACCLRQYGIKVRERDPARADAGGDGGGYRWQRVFGLFGTRICP
ncbi:hypothetical protein SLS62_009880 [Diatrype stigma]|uniref:Protection of telomeres protein 1 n=1 Tax=Diatrype stigma TaxID=117547 RepID=A0AAN9UEI8_9PEZI